MSRRRRENSFPDFSATRNRQDFSVNLIPENRTKKEKERLEAIQAEQKIDDRDEAAAAVFDKGLDSFT